MKPPKLTLRDLFWLVLVAALLCAWWSRDRQSLEQAAIAEAKIAELEAELSSPLTIRRRQNLATHLEIEALKERMKANQEAMLSGKTFHEVMETGINPPDENPYSLRIER